MNGRAQRMLRVALLISVIASAVAFGAWLPAHLFSHENTSDAVAVPDRSKKQDEKLTEEIQTLRRARCELILSELNSSGFRRLPLYEKLVRDGKEERLPGGDQRHTLDIMRRYLGAILECDDEPKLREDRLVPLLNDLKKWEAFTAALVNRQCHAWAKGDLDLVQEVRIEIQIEVLKAKRAEASGRY